MTEPELDENGYPTEETLKTITTWPYSWNGYYKLMEFVAAAWYYSDSIKRTEIGVEEKIVRHAGIRYEFNTVGWSGNESLIGALQENWTFWSMCWRLSEWGGRYVFEVPRGSIDKE